MDTLNDYLNASPVEREAEKTRRGWAPKPPTAHTHRGKPRSPELDGHHEATKTKRTPTHRRNIPAAMPASIPAPHHRIANRAACPPPPLHNARSRRRAPPERPTRPGIRPRREIPQHPHGRQETPHPH